MSFLGIDLGTGGVRCLLVSESGEILADVSRSLNQINLSVTPGHSEQDAKEWLSILRDALDELFSNSLFRNIQAVAVDSTSGTVLPVSSDGNPLAPAFLHNDVRASEEALLCEQYFGGSCSPTFSLPKILWMQNNLELADNTLFLHATDFLNSWLAGRTDIPTDSTNAMKSGVDLETGDWLENLPSLNLPGVVSPGVMIGELSPEHCQRWGLNTGVKLVSGATDSNAAFYASGAGEPGEWSTTIGTTLAIKGISEARIDDPTGCIYCHRHPDGHWLPGGASNAGGEILREHSGELSVLETSPNVHLIPNDLVYPSIRRGERLPFLDADFKPFFEGDERRGKDYLLACLEGIAFVEFLSYELLEKNGAFVGKKIFATGGAASSNLGLQIRADILQKSMHIPAHPHSAMGAAILAAAGYFNSGVGEVSKNMVSIKQVIEPSTSPVEQRLDRLAYFRTRCPL
jgi:sugar (pentulose or hexulose) kinase